MYVNIGKAEIVHMTKCIKKNARNCLQSVRNACLYAQKYTDNQNIRSRLKTKYLNIIKQCNATNSVVSLY